MQSSSPYENTRLNRHAARGLQGNDEVQHSDKVAPNLLNQNFNPLGKNEVWVGDVTYR